MQLTLNEEASHELLLPKQPAAGEDEQVKDPTGGTEAKEEVGEDTVKSETAAENVITKEHELSDQAQAPGPVTMSSPTSDSDPLLDPRPETLIRPHPDLPLESDSQPQDSVDASRRISAHSLPDSVHSLEEEGRREPIEGESDGDKIEEDVHGAALREEMREITGRVANAAITENGAKRLEGKIRAKNVNEKFDDHRQRDGPINTSKPPNIIFPHDFLSFIMDEIRSRRPCVLTVPSPEGNSPEFPSLTIVKTARSLPHSNASLAGSNNALAGSGASLAKSGSLFASSRPKLSSKQTRAAEIPGTIAESRLNEFFGTLVAFESLVFVGVSMCVQHTLYALSVMPVLAIKELCPRSITFSPARLLSATSKVPSSLRTSRETSPLRDSPHRPGRREATPSEASPDEVNADAAASMSTAPSEWKYCEGSAVQGVCVLYTGIWMASIFLVYATVDIGAVYHFIRGQSLLKMYVAYNMLEIVERLWRSLENDVFNDLALRVYRKVARPNAPLIQAHDEPEEATEDMNGDMTEDATHDTEGKDKILTWCDWKLFVLSVFGVVCVVAHTVMHLLRGLLLCIAMNSEESALFLLMMTNNFAEIKSTVFKKQNFSSLWVLSSSDIIERFQLFIDCIFVNLQLLFVADVTPTSLPSGVSLTTRSPGATASQTTTSILSNLSFLIPHRWLSQSSSLLKFAPSSLLMHATAPPGSVVHDLAPRVATQLSWLAQMLAIEVLVDFSKHAFLVKFNALRASYFTNYRSTLLFDYLQARAPIQQATLTSMSDWTKSNPTPAQGILPFPTVSTSRIGFHPLPFLTFLIVFTPVNALLNARSFLIVGLAWLWLFLLYVFVTIALTWCAVSRAPYLGQALTKESFGLKPL